MLLPLANRLSMRQDEKLTRLWDRRHENDDEKQVILCRFTEELCLNKNTDLP